MPEEENGKIEMELEPTDDETKEQIGNNESKEKLINDLKTQLAQTQEQVASYEKKIQYLLADFENLKKRSLLDVQNKTNSIVDEILLKFLSIYDDFVRAKQALAKQKINTDGLTSILKNMDSFLSEYGVAGIDALGEIFDPKLHEAISVKIDPSLDENTITSEIRKGYILQNRVIRPSLVEISKTNE